MLICLFTVLKQLPHWKCLFSISTKKSSYKINKCLLLLPTIWLLVCIEVEKLKPREINIFNISSKRWKWWNLWCPKRCRTPWVWEYLGASARWYDSSETAAQILPCIWVKLHFLGPPQCAWGCVYPLCSAQRYSHIQTCPAGPHLCIWAYAPVQAGAGGSAAPFWALQRAGIISLPGQEHQQPQKCPPSAGRAHTACSLCSRVWKARSFASDAFQHVAPKASRLCSAGGFACSACTCPSQWPWRYHCAPPKSSVGWSPSHQACFCCWWSQKSLWDPECKCLCSYSVLME